MTDRLTGLARRALRRSRRYRLRVRRGVARRVRRWSVRGRLGAELMAGLVTRRSVCVIFSGSVIDVVALTRTVRFAARMGATAEVLLLDFGRFDSTLSRVSGAVPLRRFWREAAPGGDGAQPEPPSAELTPGPIPGPRGGNWRSGYYRDGLPVMAFRKLGDIDAVDHFGTSGKPVRRDDLDERGTLVRAVDLHPETGRAMTYRYFDSQGTCWLSVSIDPRDRSLGATQQHHPERREFDEFRRLQAEWVAEHLRRMTRPRVVPIGAGAWRVMELLSDGAAAATTDEVAVPLP